MKEPKKGDFIETNDDMGIVKQVVIGGVIIHNGVNDCKVWNENITDNYGQ